MSLVLDEHRQYLADRVRLDSFERAIAERVSPGDTVVDLGSGTGILGLLACRAGARRVYSIDEGAIVGIAREIARANGFVDRMIFLRDLSTRVTLPEAADVLVTDQIGRFGFEAGLLTYTRDARRLLKPDAHIVPASVSLFAAPVEAAESWRDATFWSEPVARFDFRPVARPALSTGYPNQLAAHQVLAAPAAIGELRTSAEAATVRGRITATACRAGTVHGVCGWFEAQLSPSVTMTNSPVAPARINRRQVFFPIGAPAAVAAGDRIAIAMTIRPEDAIVAWRVEIARGAAGAPPLHFSASTFEGMLLSAEDAERTRPDFVPALTPAGRARLAVLELCDGTRTLAEIEREFAARHPELAANAGDAQEFVAEVVTRYAGPA